MRVQFSAGADRLSWAFPKLSPQLKKCATYVLEHPSEVATLSMREVATRADVPPSTMTRLARAVGFSAYNEFRDLYRNSINDLSIGRSQRASQLQVDMGETELDHTLNAFERAARLNVGGLFDHVERAVFERAATALTGARQVLVVGTFESHSAANYFHCVGAMGFRNWHLLTWHNGEFTFQVDSLTGEDVMVGISIEPWAAETINVARHARESGARVVGITDQRTSPLAAYSHDILLVPVQSPSFFPSYVAVTALVEVLVGTVVARGAKSVVEKIDDLERCRREMGSYWKD